MMIKEENKKWLEQFIIEQKRAPRILHIGNIANNAYKNVKFLNSFGFDCDVICYDYYHIMAYPEWEEVSFDTFIEDQFKPDLTKINLGNYVRPSWFAQGPLKLCIEYLVSKRSDEKEASKYWELLKSHNRSAPYNKRMVKDRNFFTRSTVWTRFLNFLFAENLVDRLYVAFFVGKGSLYIKNDLMRKITIGFLIIFLFPIRFFLNLFKYFKKKEAIPELDINHFKKYFKDVFPERVDQMSDADFQGYSQEMLMLWKKLLSQYDIVQAYATDPIIPLLCNHENYVAYEHGTLRDFTLGNSNICRLTSLAYNNAKHVFITNGDCLEYAKKIHVKKYSPMIHPIDDELINKLESKYVELHQQYSVKYLFLCTLRHDWAIKGTDMYIRALPKIQEKLGNNFKVLMTKWGKQIEESMELSRQLNCEHLIEWIEPLPRKKLVEYKKSVDIVFDQLALPHFGATAPEAIACGVPVIMSYNPESTKWIIPEAAPILSAHNVDDIVICIEKAIDTNWKTTYQKEAKNWFEKYHNSSIVIDKHIEVYKKILQ